MEVFFLIGSFISFFFGFLFWNKGKMISPHKVLIVFFILNGLVLLDHYLETTELLQVYPHLIGLTYALPIIIGPIIYFYTLILTTNKKVNFYKFWRIHAIPFLLVLLYFASNFYFLSAAEKLNYFRMESEVRTSVGVYISEWILNLSIPIYTVLSIFRLNSHSVNLKNRFSYTENINLKWLKHILFFFLSVSIISLLTNFFSDIIPVISYTTGDNLSLISLTIVLIYIAFYGIKQKAIYPEFVNNPEIEVYPDENTNDIKTSSIKEDDVKELLAMINKEQPYLNNKLSLKDLADRLNLSENKMSELINNGLNKNFYDLINEYRINEVKMRILDPKNNNLTILAIAYDCGFNSKSSFNSIFKKYTDMTPSQYKKIYS